MKAGVTPGEHQQVGLPPVHAGEDDGALRGVLLAAFEVVRQERSELIIGHLADAHGKAAVSGFTVAADHSFDLDVIGRVGEHAVDRSPRQDQFIATGLRQRFRRHSPSSPSGSPHQTISGT